MEEEKKVTKQFEICRLLKLFGRCNESNCAYRHLLDKSVDIVEFIPNSGKIRFQIVDMHNVSHFSIRVIEHMSDNDKQTLLPSVKDITEELTDFLKNSKSKAISKIPGQFYAYLDEDYLFYRCRILECDNDTVTIILVDKGNIINTPKTRLFKLPSEFSMAKHPPQSK